LSAVYSAAAAWRRRRYALDASRRRRLEQPVISVGNLRVGGSGKTPLVEYIARLLLQSGERPAVLTRGYGRRVADDGVTVVSDGAAVLASLDRAGDEPLMPRAGLAGRLHRSSAPIVIWRAVSRNAASTRRSTS
jgi:tetraacyldisaccharide 4'-kinase